MRWGKARVTQRVNDRRFTDLWRHLGRDARRDWAGFHMPGHGYGSGFPRSFRHALARMDITEVPGMDDLSHPGGILRDAQDRLAALMDADRSFFLVNGSSTGIIAMMTALCRPGDSLIVPRASHRAVYHGLALGGISPAYLYTKERDNRPALPAPENVNATLTKYPQVKGMVLTSPDYWGRCADVAAIAQVLHRRGKALLLDQAHGAHFGFHPALPPHGGTQGADAWVQSAHKTLPALTQSAWLHRSRSALLSGERLAQQINVLQTTSPSYPMMGGLDYARYWLAQDARDAYTGLLGRIDRGIATIERVTPVRRAELVRDGGVVNTDPTRLVLDLSGMGMGAGEVEVRLLANKVRVEWAQGAHLVLICTPWHRTRDFSRLIGALRRIPRQSSAARPKGLSPLPEAEMILPIGQALDRTASKIDYREAAGQVAGAFVIPYPPGIPLLCPGERVTAAHVEWIGRCIETGRTPAGVDGGYMDVLQ